LRKLNVDLPAVNFIMIAKTRAAIILGVFLEIFS